ncbi:unnamed protein product [Adineta steineri]|uniref:Arrestin-like N-terminal domain-containing protein n=1 Tax=Adineta steineri TaxID=433720 RepID=A0A814WLK6_9BILA|nr:unnamed protein product [Adineta steineri]CAF1204009.1 unnamed protein product [Adineta steineri]CAF1224562.1 unnamed protein product [Adineta steineri]CAF3580733.1 unnamed protein product [Adineta steineri]CAF3741654.1 unnamed protein product [Adineta steineri]
MGCGASNSNVIFNFDRAKPLFAAGEIISGTVQLNVKDDSLKVNEIDLQLIGATGYSTRSTDGNQHSRTNYHYVRFFATQYVFALPNGGERELTYSNGQYSWPFQIQLPDQIPPTMNLPRLYPHVRYYLQLAINKGGQKRKIGEEKYITVFPRVSLSQQVPNYMTATMFGNHNRKDITVKGTLNKTGFVPGEMIQGTLEIENPNQILIKQVDLSINGTYNIQMQEAHFKVNTGTVQGIAQRKGERMVEKFEIMIPDKTLSPSYQFRGGQNNAAAATCSYMLKFEIKAAGVFTNFEILVPFILGTQP